MDCYVRLSSGVDKKTGKSTYKLFQIIKVEEKQGWYSFPKVGKDKAVSTNKFLKVKNGRHTSNIRMIMASDSRPNQEDVQNYMNQLKNVRSNEVLSKKMAVKIYNDQQDLVNTYQYTREDIERSVMEKKRNNKYSNIGMEKTRADTSVKAVKHILEEETLQLEEIRAKLESNPNMDDATEDQLLNQRSYQENAVNEAQADYEAKLAEQCKILQLDETLKTRLKNRKNVTNLSNVNQRARKANEKAAFMSYKQQRVKEEKVAANGVTLDFYARRKAKPKNLWEVGQTKT
jgi:hypothetical protein